MRLRMLIVLYYYQRRTRKSSKVQTRTYSLHDTKKGGIPRLEKKMHRHESLESWAFGDGSNSPEKYPSSSANR